MEGSSSTSHFRSISLPSRLTNPSCTKIETKINELKALGSLVVSSESIQSGLVGLAELYVCVEELVRSPKTQPPISRHQNGAFIEDALEGSIGLLDLCGTLKDMIMLMRENVQILQSALRRKGGNSTVATHIAMYLSFRKKTKKNVTKTLGTLKNLEKKMGSFLLLDVDHHVSLMVNKVLGEVYALTISQFKSVLVFVSTKTKSTSGVQLISKLVSKSTSTQARSITSISEMETIDLVITSLQKSLCNGDTKNVDIQMTLKKLQILGASLEGFEAGLDCVFRRLIQSRASLLNIIDIQFSICKTSKIKFSKMEGSSSTSHFRSISLPSRLTNPSCTKIETKINELKALGSLVVSSECIQSGLVGLAELYLCVEEHVRSPKTEPALSRHQNGNLVEDALEGSIGLLDLCSTLKDMIMLMRENVQILQSALRRKGGNSTVATHIATYLSFRKKTKKNVTKSLGTLKNLEKKMGSFLLLDVNHHVSLMVNKGLGEVYSLTVALFKSILDFVSTKAKSTSGVELISKLVSKSTSTQARSMTSISEMETIDLAITSLQKSSCNSDTKNVDIQMTLKKLQILDASLEGFEAGLDCIFRRLIQNRASLLNIMTNQLPLQPSLIRTDFDEVTTTFTTTLTTLTTTLTNQIKALLIYGGIMLADSARFKE
ncbi:hypothetical protein OSB04_000623 [Centaurea solstitialis]|uniref:Uncharacterized protein n=1 Tax=Centaurea solstitialis TaxID=347529 RepID=A0AA38U7S3_9ASTR|nr:hypothetical protein OSB04_000623 [Centaurea solstitialis]